MAPVVDEDELTPSRLARDERGQLARVTGEETRLVEERDDEGEASRPSFGHGRGAYRDCGTRRFPWLAMGRATYGRGHQGGIDWRQDLVGIVERGSARGGLHQRDGPKEQFGARPRTTAEGWIAPAVPAAERRPRQGPLTRQGWFPAAQTHPGGTDPAVIRAEPLPSSSVPPLERGPAADLRGDRIFFEKPIGTATSRRGPRWWQPAVARRRFRARPSARGRSPLSCPRPRPRGRRRTHARRSPPPRPM